MTTPPLKSALYHGRVRHTRQVPKCHDFTYDVFMLYLDLAEVDRVFHLSRLWSARHWAPARFCRDDFLGSADVPLDQAVRQRIFDATGCRFNGSIRMLANLRYFGFLMNPLVVYYCFDDSEQLAYMVAEVTNTPWRERHSYVLPCHPNRSVHRIAFPKALHVSPFNDMDMEYRWRSNTPDDKLGIYLANWRGDRKEFDASLVLSREPISQRSLNQTILRYPFMTAKVGAAIYWQALKLFVKGVPFVAHPDVSRQPQQS